ncbi:hypothetical protein ACFX13_008443 [Malus domestica]
MTSGKVSCLADSATTHTVLRERIYFTNFVPKNAPLTTLLGPSNLIEGYGKARIMLSNGTILTIAEALYSPRSGKTLLSFKDIRDNNYHAETHVENGVEFMCVTFYEYGQKRILEKMERHPSGLYTTTIRPIECHYVAGPTTGTAHEITLWHDRLGHPGRIAMHLEHPIPHVHTQNGLAEAFIKRLQMIARSLVIRTKLPIAAWGHAILHAAKLVCLRPVATQPFSAL